MILTFSSGVNAQHNSDTVKSKIEKTYQAKAPPTQPFGKEAFEKSNETTIRRLVWQVFSLTAGAPR